MLKKLLVLLLASVLAFPLATAVFAQDAPAKAKAAEGGALGRSCRTKQR